MAQTSRLAPVPRTRVSFEQFLRETMDEHAEWVDGEIVPMAPVTIEHVRIARFLLNLLQPFVERRGLGELVFDPFVMKTGPELPGRAPDIVFIASQHRRRLHDTYLEGPGDLVIEVVTKDSRTRDRVHKFREYEVGGVPEYWVIDPATRQGQFFTLGADGRYEPLEPVDGVVTSKSVPGFWIRIEWLWSRPAVQQALAEIER